MSHDFLLNLIGIPLLVPLAFAYLAALVVGIVGVVRSLAASSPPGAKDQR